MGVSVRNVLLFSDSNWHQTTVSVYSEIVHKVLVDAVFCCRFEESSLFLQCAFFSLLTVICLPCLLSVNRIPRYICISPIFVMLWRGKRHLLHALPDTCLPAHAVIFFSLKTIWHRIRCHQSDTDIPSHEVTIATAMDASDVEDGVQEELVNAADPHTRPAIRFPSIQVRERLESSSSFGRVPALKAH